MASLALKCCFTLVALCLSLCMSVGNPVDITDGALECFNDHYVYSSCQEDYRLNVEGVIHVPPEVVDGYCSGPCLAETKLVLKCVDGILDNFRFYNGASIRDVYHTLDIGCGHTEKRGDFDVLENLGAEGYGDYYGEGNKLALSNALLMIVFCACFLLW